MKASMSFWVVVFVMIIGIVVVVGGVPSIIKLSFVIIGFCTDALLFGPSTFKPADEVNSSFRTLKKKGAVYKFFVSFLFSANEFLYGLVFPIRMLALAMANSLLLLGCKYNQQSVAGWTPKLWLVFYVLDVDVPFGRAILSTTDNE
ncbi:hypothetical protein Tco_1475476 [Tanacetum coccineum]